MLANQTLSRNEKNCILFRGRERRILQQTLELAKQRLNKALSGWNERESDLLQPAKDRRDDEELKFETVV